jgi:hypothetical protein
MELHIPLATILIQWCDNINVTFLAFNLIFRVHTKHVKIDYHFVQEPLASNQGRHQGGCQPVSGHRFNSLKNKAHAVKNNFFLSGRSISLIWTPLPIVSSSTPSSNALHVRFFTSKDQLDDVFTKPLLDA